MIRWFSNQSRLALIVGGLVLLVAAAAVFAFPANAAHGSQPALQDKPTNDYCLSCHSKPGVTPRIA